MKLDNLLDVIVDTETIVIRYYPDADPIAIYDGLEAIPVELGTCTVREMFVDHGSQEINIIIEEE